MFSVCIPAHNCADTLRETMRDVLLQTYRDFELIISDDNSTDDIDGVVKQFGDKRIRYYKNGGNQLGCGGNERKCRGLAKGEFIMMLPGKARISKRTLERYHYIFNSRPEVGAITRPYFWFGKDINHVVRAKEISYPIDMVIDIKQDAEFVINVFKTVDNSGAIAYRKEWLTEEFNDAHFVEFTYPFAGIFKNHKVALVGDYIMGVPAFKHSHSQDKEVYKTSPMKNWIDMFNKFYDKKLVSQLIDRFVAVNYIGLVQVRNYGTYFQYLREVWYLVKYRRRNLINLKFWFFFLGTLLTQRFILKYLVKRFKQGRNLKNVRLF